MKNKTDVLNSINCVFVSLVRRKAILVASGLQYKTLLLPIPSSIYNKKYSLTVAMTVLISFRILSILLLSFNLKYFKQKCFIIFLRTFIHPIRNCIVNFIFFSIRCYLLQCWSGCIKINKPQVPLIDNRLK